MLGGSLLPRTVSRGRPIYWIAYQSQLKLFNLYGYLMPFCRHGVVVEIPVVMKLCLGSSSFKTRARERDK
jgi:hypothetical protein